VTSIADQLGARPADDGATTLSFPREMHGAFGGAFGGLLAAGAVHVGRDAAPGRVPAGIDCHFLRGLRAGDTTATRALLHEGRSLTCVRVDLTDEQGRVATTATVTYVDPAALHPLDVEDQPMPEPESWREWATPAGVEIPVVAVLQPRLAALAGGAIAAALRVPWDDPDDELGAEAACLAGDFCVGPPVAAACEGAWLPHPNPDFSLRFGPVAAVGAEVVGVGRVVRIANGLAVVDVEVAADGRRYSAGAATSMVLRGETR
jgi:acyl-coenzyme A thioesterase PaaI-like protein